MTRLPRCRPSVLLAGALLMLATQADAQSRTPPSSSQGSATLDEILIEHSGEPEPELPLGMGISGDSLKNAPGAAGDPLRALQSLPSMTFVDDESIAPAVRGSGPDDNTFQADFLPVGYLFHAGGAISVFNAELIESFSLYPSAYGPEFFGVTGGAFDIRLRDPNADRLGVTLDVNVLQAGLLVEGPVTDEQRFYLAGRFSYLDLLIEDQLDEDEGIEFVQFPKYSDYQAKHVWDLNERSTLRFQATGATDEQELKISDDAEDIDTEPLLAGRHVESSRFDQQGVVWDYETGSGHALKAAIGHDTTRNDAAFGGAGDVASTVDSWRTKAHLLLPLNSQHDVTIGAELVTAEVDFDLTLNDPGCTEFEPDCQISNAERLTTREQVRVNSQHAFIKDAWYLSDRLTLFPGLSVQHEDYLGEHFVEPRLAMEYALDDSLTLSAGFGQYHQMPAISEVNADFGSPSLDYIEAIHALVGVEKRSRSGWSVKSELYYKHLDHLIAGDPETRYNNAGEGEAYGWDTLIRKDLGERFSGWLSVSLSKARRENTVTDQRFAFAYDQPVNVSLLTRYQYSPRWSFGAKLWVHSGALYAPVTGATADASVPGLFNPEYGAINSERLPSFHRLDLRADRLISAQGHRRITGYIELLNAFDQQNVLGYDYNRDYSQRVEVTQLSRIIGLGIKAEF